MALNNVAVAAKDGQNTPVAIPGGIRQHDTSGTGSGPNVPEVVVVDSAGAEILGVTSAAKVVTDAAGSLQQYLRGLVSLFANITFTNTRMLVRGEPRAFAVAASAVTRPTNTTAYSANDAVSNNATAGSVTAISFTLSDTNDDPITLERCRVLSTDTGLAGNMLRIYLYQSDPTASTGVVGGDNAAFSTKQGTFIGSMSGTLKAFSDGSGGVLVADDGSRIVVNPTSGAKTIFGLLMTPTGFTPSANSTTITPTLEGFQARA